MGWRVMEGGWSSAGYGSAGGQPKRRALAKGADASWCGAVRATTPCCPTDVPLAKYGKLREGGGRPPQGARWRGWYLAIPWAPADQAQGASCRGKS